jgi:hypothetical protein
MIATAPMLLIVAPKKNTSATLASAVQRDATRRSGGRKMNQLSLM